MSARSCHLRLSVFFALAMGLMTGSPLLASPQVGGRAVISQSGYPLKGITRTATALFDSPDPENARQRPYKAFQFVYILPPDPDGPLRYDSLVKGEDTSGLQVNGMYRVGISQRGGGSASDQAGYLRAEDVQLWGHIQSLQFTPKEDRDRAFFFETPGELEEYFAGDDREDLPVAGEPEVRGDNLIIMPVLDEVDIELDGEGMSQFRCAFLAGVPSGVSEASFDEEGGAVATEGITLEEATAALGVDVVFVIDTTSSMTPAFEYVRKSVKKVAADLREAGLPQLRFGLVGYRDKDDEYVSKVFCDLAKGADVEFFLSTVDRLKAEGGGDVEEDVFAGLRLALDSEAVKWAPSSARQNIVILIGDAPGHDVTSDSNSTKNNAATILKMAQPESVAPGGRSPVSFYVRHLKADLVDVADPELLAMLTDEEVEELRGMWDEFNKKGRDQFQALSESARYPGPYHSSSMGVDFSGEMGRDILRWVENMGKIRDRGGVIEAGALESGSGVMQPSHQIEWLRQVRATESQKNAAQGIRFGKAYVAEFGRDGSRMFVPHVFVEKSQLEVYAQTLNWLRGLLEKAGKPGSKDVQSIVRQVAAFTASINLGVEFSDPESLDALELSKLFMAMTGLPSQTSIFSVTLPELAQMAPSDWEEWLAELDAKIRSLSALQDTPSIWWPLDDDSQESGYHAFIKLSDLPSR